MTTATPFLLVRRLSRGQLFAFDAVLAAAVGLLGWYAAAASPSLSHPGWREPAWISAFAGVLLGLPVAARRRRPIAAAGTVLAVAVACVVTGVIPDYAGSAPTAAVGLVLYTVGTDVARRWSIVTVLACVVGIALAFALVRSDPFGVALVAWVVGACWTVGRTIRERRAYAARGAEQATALAVGEERLRLARELHDIVAHSMSVIAVKATIANHVADERPQEMREALRVIASTSRGALGELRRALGVLRSEAAMAPAPGLGDLDDLVAAGRSTGLDVDLEFRGRRELPQGVGLAVFRIVQEALTNVVRHADATTCRVEVDVGSHDSVRIRVTDNGAGLGRSSAEPDAPRQDRPGQDRAGPDPTGPDPTGAERVGAERVGAEWLGSEWPGSERAGLGRVGLEWAGPEWVGSERTGHEQQVGQKRAGQGLIGMRERAVLSGGDFSAGPAPDGGWIVEVTLRGVP